MRKLVKYLVTKAVFPNQSALFNWAL